MYFDSLRRKTSRRNKKEAEAEERACQSKVDYGNGICGNV